MNDCRTYKDHAVAHVHDVEDSFLELHRLNKNSHWEVEADLEGLKLHRTAKHLAVVNVVKTMALEEQLAMTGQNEQSVGQKGRDFDLDDRRKRLKTELVKALVTVAEIA